MLFIRGKKLPLRGTIEERRLPLSPFPVRIWQHMIVWSALVVARAFLFKGSGKRTVFALALTSSLTAAIVMLSMVVITGYVGQISLVQMALAGAAAFVMARMMADGSTTISNPFVVNGPGLPWPVAALIGVLAVVLVGVAVGLPAVRIRGVQLAVVAVAAAISLQTLYFESDKLTDLTAGSPAHVNPASFFGIDLRSIGDKGQLDRPSFAIFVLVVLLTGVFLVANLRRNGTGRRFLAVRADERAAAAAGINVSRTDVSSTGLVYQASLACLAFAYLGGITSINAAIVGGLLAPAGVIAVSSNYFSAGTNVDRYATVLGGLGMIVTAIHNPNGIAPTLQPLFQRFGRWLRAARGAEWGAAGKRLGPTALIGAVLGALAWPIRVDPYSWLWMPLLGALLALFIRGQLKQSRGPDIGATSAGETTSAAPIPTMEVV